MNQPSYAFDQDEAALRFDFESVSDQRVIHKRIEYSVTTVPDLYNLALGDVLPNGVLDDTMRSNNDDRDKVMATVVQTLLVFLRQYPDRYVIFSGSTESRTRLYRVIISRELDNALELFDIYGVIPDGGFELFQADSQYIAFLITGKK